MLFIGVTGSIAEKRELLKEYRKTRYQEIHDRLAQGATGGQIIASLTDLADEIIEQLYRRMIQSASSNLRWRLEDGFSIVALGGYGRGELAPFSDIDLMFLYQDSFREMPQKAASEILQTLWDIGYYVGHSFRTIDDCIEMGKKDLTVRTSLMEARFLAGSQGLFNSFRGRFNRKVVLRGPASYAAAKIRERQADYRQYGTTVYLLEPHVKMSQGGLRDLHLFRWIALCYYHTASLQTLKHLGVLSSMDYKALASAQEFLWRVRNELHFEAGRCHDLLTFEEQIRLSRLWGFQDKGHLLGVERFMKLCYEVTTTMLDITRHMLDRMIASPFAGRIKKYLRQKSIDGRFVIAGDEVSISAEGRSAVLEDAGELLRLFHLAQVHNARLSFETKALIKNALEAAPLITKMDGEAASMFLRILNSSGNVTDVLHELHSLKLLEEIIPEFSRARGLMQFNEYHKFTVDEHCIRSVEEADLLRGQPGRISRIYHEIQRKDILHLALLIHDLGKGCGPDHSKIGAEIAERIADRMMLDPQARDFLVFLVRQHLLMTRIAFRRDLSDENILLRFAKTVATQEVLKMLYIMTLADVAAVGPGTLTAWKKDLLTELFEKTLEILTGEKAVIAEDEKIGQVKEWVMAHVEDSDREWAVQQLSQMTTSYLLLTPRHLIVRHLGHIKNLLSAKVLVDAEYDKSRHITEYTIYTSDDLTQGIFYKIAGVLAAKGLQILGANIVTWKNGTVVDTFQVQDTDFADAPIRGRLEEVSSTIRDVLQGRLRVEELLADGRRIKAKSRVFPVTIPTQVEVDNGSSDQYTIIEVFAQDRQGLLFIIAKAIFELGLSVYKARVATQLDQIVDVFYVTDRSGRKIMDPEYIQRVKDQISSDISI